uniref:Uncharacterized protein n=1 Tax=Salix viminalis TaxID=40686 RepID=A0A6N2KXL6_SALVM
MGGDKLGGVREKKKRRGLCSDSHISAGHRWIRLSFGYVGQLTNKPDHLKISGNPLKPVGVAGQFLHRPPLDFSDFLVSILLKKIAKSAFFFQSEPPAIFASYHRWMKLKFWYVVLLSVINVLNGGDEELTVQQGDMYVEQ